MADSDLPVASTPESAHDQDGHVDLAGQLALLKQYDRDLYLLASRKMVNYLCWVGVDGAQDLLRETYGQHSDPISDLDNGNVPGPAGSYDQDVLLSGRPFKLASSVLGDDKVQNLIQGWVVEEKTSFLPKILNNPRSTLEEVVEGLRRFNHLIADGAELSPAAHSEILVSLIRRILTERLDLITIAKEFFDTNDIREILGRVIASSEGHGPLGGKSAKLLLARQILERETSGQRPVGQPKIPRSWFISSEEITVFLEYNHLEEVLQQKYREIDRVRHEYPNIVQLFKNSRFPPALAQGLSVLLDEVGETPLIVRSSSLLEDRLGSAFSGKYRSLYLGNQGTKQQRLAALMNAVTEVYASVFGPDPIAYRDEKGLIDYHEKMSVLIQEVVGKRVGDYFFPALSGVAVSTNEFRWSPRIRREDGLIRLVPGLGTRAVNRMSNDYPILVVPGQPNLKVNATIEEAVRYSPQQIDVINLRKNTFETLSLKDLLRECRTDYPAFGKIFSVLKDDTLQPAVPIMVNPERDELVADFNGLVSGTPFVQHVGDMLKTLEEKLGTPVDIEFAFDGDEFYLLQCRAQSYADQAAPAPIPKEVPENDVVFYANRHVSNGWIPDITHIVYVDPDGYARLESRTELLAIGQAVGRLNKLLPKRRFILMGPGRWGSRGDITLGVNVTYADINNTAMLIEIARQRGNYVPDLSFGTHFFQDLIESEIRYLPLYPDESKGVLNERFLFRAPNLLAEMLPEHSGLSDALRVVDVSGITGGRVLRVLMNADLDEAIGMLADPEEERDALQPRAPSTAPGPREEHWRWRMYMAEKIAANIDAPRLGVQALYVFGSTKNASAGPSSDIDLLVHFRGTEDQLNDLESWFDGWSACLGEMNYLRTGYPTPHLLDVHIVTDEDIENQTSYATKIGAVTDAALELPTNGDRPSA